ncbi:MAG: fimbrillin family protein [Prevotellaceae bacterium]|jgi:hypothetical protein|nr:fimbrillin family protein [Prevotellaceae bacterium]
MKHSLSKIWAIAILTAIAASSCEKNNESDPPAPPPVNPPVPIVIAVDPHTRATDAGYENGDKVGIFVVNYASATTPGTLTATTGNHVNNMRFAFDGAKWTPDQTVYWKDQTTKADFYCYYPYRTSLTSVSDVSVSVPADQSTMDKYKTGDFLWGKATSAPTTNAVSITTNHVMSNLIITLEAGEGYTTETLAAAKKQITINSTKATGTLHLATGTVTATGTASDITPLTVDGYYRALIVPQTVTDATLITLTIDDQSYTLKQTITFKANTQHKCKLTVGKVGNGINIGIGGWESDENDYGGSVN